jgi:hypothetical protein
MVSVLVWSWAVLCGCHEGFDVFCAFFGVIEQVFDPRRRVEGGCVVPVWVVGVV